MTNYLHFVLRALWITLFFNAAEAASPLRVVTTIPDLAEVIQSVGGNRVQVESLLDGSENVHFVDAMPSFITKVASADVVCAIGLELEVGWLKKVLEKSGQANVQPGGSGFCEAGSSVEVIDKPTKTLDRSMGDVHAGGNPHFNLSPTSLAQAARGMTEVLIRLRPEWREEFLERLKQFEQKMQALQTEVKGILKNASSQPMIEYHKEFAYFFKDYGLKSVGSIEEKPGVPPSAARLADVAKMAQASKVKVALASHTTSEKFMQQFQNFSQISYVKVPTMVQKKSALNTIEKLQKYIASEIVKRL